MGGNNNRRKRSESDGGGEEPPPERKMEILPSMIKNKEKRSAVHAKLKQQKKLEKRKKSKARDAAEKRPPAKKIPKTIENTREVDETVCKPDDEELFAGNDADEFSSILKRELNPKILLAVSILLYVHSISPDFLHHSEFDVRGPEFIKELPSVIPNATYYKRGTYDLKKIVEYANKKDFTSLIVVYTNRREPGWFCLVLKGSINHGNPTSHEPELVLKNLTTRLGHRIGRLCSLSLALTEKSETNKWAYL
ncbi:unnamed protein product [Malus baccata var. baccata]